MRAGLLGALGALLLGGVIAFAGTAPALAAPEHGQRTALSTQPGASHAKVDGRIGIADASGSSSKEQGADSRTQTDGGAESGSRGKWGVLAMIVVLSVIAVASGVSGIVLQRRPGPGVRRGL